MPFQIRYTSSALEHLASIERRYHPLVRHAIDERLTHEPLAETRNRKPLRQPSPYGARWELRCGPNNRLRVLYSVDEENSVVVVLAIGIKDRERLLIGGEEMKP